MTVIASFNINNFPILLGDLLISGNEDLESSLNIPTIGKITEIFPKGSDFVPTGLKQKTAILNENLALAWAGKRMSAQIIIRNLFIEAQKKTNWKRNDLSSFFSDYKEHLNDVGIVGFSNDGKEIFSFGCGAHQIKYDSKKYGLVRLGGNGETHLKSYLDNCNIQQVSKTTNSLEEAVGNALAITTHMTGFEKTTGSNLLYYYGGGFEILSLVQNKFKKFGDITYLIWLARQTNDVSWELSLPVTCIKYSYDNDILLIKKADIEAQPNGNLTTINKAIYGIYPIYRNVKDKEIDIKKANLSSFNSLFICSFVFFNYINGPSMLYSRVDYNRVGTHLIRFKEEAGEILELKIHDNLIKSIVEHVRPQT
jgi:hypothetical protein